MGLLIEKGDAQFRMQMINLANKIDNYAVALELTAADVASIKADAAALDYAVSIQMQAQVFAQSVTAFKKMVRYGDSKPIGYAPEAPELGPAPALPKGGMEARVRKLLQRMVHHQAYARNIGEDLGIEAPVSTFKPERGKPKFTIELSSGGYPNLRWKKGKYQGVEIWKDSGEGFVKLDRDMRPDYIDKSNLPPQGTTALWSYKMIYLLNDEVVGEWSGVVSVTVYGAV